MTHKAHCFVLLMIFYFNLNPFFFHFRVSFIILYCSVQIFMMIFELRQPVDLMIAKRAMEEGPLKYMKSFGFINLVDESVWVVGWGIDLDLLALVLGLQGLDGLALLGVLNAAGCKKIRYWKHSKVLNNDHAIFLFFQPNLGRHLFKMRHLFIIGQDTLLEFSFWLLLEGISFYKKKCWTVISGKKGGVWLLFKGIIQDLRVLKMSRLILFTSC